MVAAPPVCVAEESSAGLKSVGLRPILFVIGVAALCGILAAELALSVRQESQTSDEGAHILAGYRSWKYGDFGINPEHPPLVKLVSTLPLIRLPVQVPPLSRGYFRGAEFLGGEKFLYSNDAETILWRARLAASSFTFGLALAVFFSARSVWGSGPALLALALLVFEPNVLAHGALVTTDMGVTFGLFLSVAAYSAYAKRPSWWRLLLAGVAVGVALSTKHSGILVLPILVLLAAVEWGLDLRPVPGSESRNAVRRARQIASSLAVIFAIAGIVLWSSYGFRYSARPPGLQLDPPLAEFASQGSGPGPPLVLALARWKLLPEAYLYGLADVFGLAGTTPTFLFGKFYAQGQWFYFPSVFVIKSTLGFLLLLLLAPFAKGIFGRVRAPRLPGGQALGARPNEERLRESLFFLIPPVFYFLAAIHSEVNIGVRHLLPVYPFLAVLAAAGAWSLARKGRGYAVLIGCLVAFHAASSVRAFPNYLPYSNEVWGGPAKTYRVLSDSNVDWSQGLKAMHRYLDHEKIRDCWFAYFGSVIIDSSYYGIACKPLPTSFERLAQASMPVIPPVIDGPVFLSASEISGPLWGSDAANPYVGFRRMRPAAVIGGSILVYEGRTDASAAAALTHESASRDLLRGGSLDRALREAETAVSLAPNRAEAHLARGNVLAKMNRGGDAIHEFEIARKFANGFRPAE